MATHIMGHMGDGVPETGPNQNIGPGSAYNITFSNCSGINFGDLPLYGTGFPGGSGGGDQFSLVDSLYVVPHGGFNVTGSGSTFKNLDVQQVMTSDAVATHSLFFYNGDAAPVN